MVHEISNTDEAKPEIVDVIFKMVIEIYEMV